MKPRFAAAARNALRFVGLKRPLQALYRRLAFPVLPPRSPGPLSEQTARALTAAATALLSGEIDTTRYEEFFRWRAEAIPGHRALYERFAATVDGLAQGAGNRDFAGSDPAVRLGILRPAFRVRTAHHRLDRLRIGIFQGKWVLFDLHIVRQMALLFARTDAWRLAGYDAWPGTPRGLERYRMPPADQPSDGGSPR